MNYKKRKNFDKRKRKKIQKPRYKATFISLSNPIVKKLLGKKAYQAYLERQGGDEDE